ncbi:MAG: tRNA1(Val) (adenine(37)-N6)-methyltransferase [Paenibacillaceae bacterium]
MTHQLRIIQSDEVFSFSLDAVLLARFCTVPLRGKIIDLCTGNAVIPLLLSTRTKASIHAIEIQERLADMAERSVAMNQLQGQIHIIQGDLRRAHEKLGHGAFDLVTVNPPYLPVVNGVQNSNMHFAAARHEIHCNLEEVVASCAKLIRSGGKVAMVHRPSRLADIMSLMRQYRLEPKRIRFVHPRVEEEANMVLVEAMKDGKPELRLLPPVIAFKNKNDYSDELMDIFYGKKQQ